ncbi:hypothetical protein AB833_31380 [Chromatiales bacterium (ex Bugula neritina AB1)]|nr:hypothetical protein AB833_31380 [Chromatiales bacterium (ex Bugula neritina AB1)]
MKTAENLGATALPLDEAHPHGYVTKTIHWLSCGLIAYGHVNALGSVWQLLDPTVYRNEIIFGLLLLAVFSFRLFWTQRIAGVTRLPATSLKWEQTLSRTIQWGLYASVFGIILSGFAIAIGFSVSAAAFNGGFLSASIGLHRFALGVLPLLLVMHVAGALWHKFVRRDGVLESMTGKLPI